MATNFDRIARPYRWLEYFSFGPMLERCRFYRIAQLASTRRVLVLGDGDGRFLARLLAANPALHADAVDQSAAMLRLLGQRVAAVGAASRVRIHQADALTFRPDEGPYDAVVTHFFLDCFSTGEVLALAESIRPRLTPDAVWIVSEFAIPHGVAGLPARSIVAALYAAFRLITGLRTRRLPNYAAALGRAGFTLQEQKSFLGGLLVSERWRIDRH
jgi:SAM-dependent methyltransferase